MTMSRLIGRIALYSVIVYATLVAIAISIYG